MLQKAKVFGIQLNNKWTYQNTSGERHLLHVVWSDPMPTTNTNIGRKVEVLKVSTNVVIPEGLKPGDDVEIDFNRFGRPALIQIVGNKDAK